MKLDQTELPPGWVWTTMEEIADVVGGGTPKTNDPTNYKGGKIPWLTPADLSGYTEKHIGYGARNITQKGLDTSSAKMMPAGAVLFTSRAPIGYVAIASNPVCTNQGFKSFVLKGNVLPDYVYWWLKGSKDLAESMASGTTFLELSGAKAKQIPIPVAPLDQQKRIVAEIEKQFSRLDEAVANLKRAKANLKRYKAAVLKAAVEGRLVENEAELARREGRSYETGEQLLQRILETRRSQRKGKDKCKELAAPGTTGLSELPEGWEWMVSDVIFDFVTSGSRGWAKYYSDSGSIFIRVGNLDHGTIELDLSEVQHVLAPTNPEAGRSRVSAGDLLISITAELGMVAVVPEHLGEAYVNQHVAIARSTDLLDKSYIGWYFACEHAGKKQLESLRRGATKAGLGLDDIRSVYIALPPLNEQRSIVAEVDRRLSLLYETEAQVDANLIRAQSLRQSILSTAFNGELVTNNGCSSSDAHMGVAAYAV